jgi:hypothetical protein
MVAHLTQFRKKCFSFCVFGISPSATVDPVYRVMLINLLELKISSVKTYPT